jgi:hypothetical protein
VSGRSTRTVGVEVVAEHETRPGRGLDDRLHERRMQVRPLRVRRVGTVVDDGCAIACPLGLKGPKPEMRRMARGSLSSGGALRLLLLRPPRFAPDELITPASAKPRSWCSVTSSRS